MRNALRALIVCCGIQTTAYGYARGGETGTLDQEPESDPVATAILDLNRAPTKNWSPYFMHRDHFRRLRARLSYQPIAPIPGWDSYRAYRYRDRYFTEDGAYEILPFFDD